MSVRKRLIVLRFSAMGDVAMVASVLNEFTEQYPDVELIVVSRPAFKAFFETNPQVIFHAIQPKAQHKGLKGLWNLYQELRAYQVDAVADLHDHIRSRVLSLFFRLQGTKICRIDKGRAEKKALTRANHKVLIPLKLTVERYADVFRALGFPFTLSHQLKKSPQELPLSARVLFEANDKRFIGIAPFAQHAAKVYNLNLMEEVVKGLSEKAYRLFIFGGGEQEKAYAQKLAKKYAHVFNMIGDYSLKEELAIISHLDLMLSMDSSGMHMASLMGVPVVSVWGATHPYAGFLGYGQRMSDCLQVNHSSRPNSIYGNKACDVDGKPIIDYIAPETIIKAIENHHAQANHSS